MKHIAILSFLIGISIFFTSCSSLVRGRDEIATKHIKKAALAGFTVQQPTPKGQRSPENSNEMYSKLRNAFKKKTGWNILEEGTLSQNAAYVRAYDKTMKGFQNKMPPPQGISRVFASRIMDNDSLRVLGVDGRKQLMKDLNVDALITANIDVLLEGTTFAGFGARHVRSTISFQVFGKDSDSPVWYDGDVSGEQLKRSLTGTGFFDQGLLTEMAIESLETAFKKM